MAKLSITDAQKTAVVDPADTYLQDAFAEGVSAPSNTSLLPAMEKYTDLTSAQQTSVKATFRAVLAALAKCLGTSAFQSGLTTTVNYTKVGGAPGTLTFTNGVLTSQT